MKPKYKKAIVAAVITTLLLSPIAQANTQFSDVAPESGVSKAITYVKSASTSYNGEACIKGYPDGTFQPNRDVSRVEVLKLVLTCIDLPSLDKDVTINLTTGDEITVGNNKTTITQPTQVNYKQKWQKPNPKDDPKLKFSDVDLNDWYVSQGVLQEGLHRGLVQGANGKFSPATQVNLAELLTILLRAQKLLKQDFKVDLAKLPSYINSKEWYAEPIAFGLQNKLISVREGEQLAVFYGLNRAETIIIIYNFLLANGVTTQVQEQPPVKTPETPTPQPPSDPQSNNTPTTETSADKVWQVGDIESGIASYYGDEFEGQKTASGRLLSQVSFLAAHKTLPFGTRIKVTNPETQRFIIATVVDRGPFVEGRILDLTQSAFIELAELSAGLVQVKMEILSLP